MTLVSQNTSTSLSQHIKRIFMNNKLKEQSVIKEYLITDSDRKSFYGYIFGILIILNILARYPGIRNLRIPDEYYL